MLNGHWPPSSQEVAGLSPANPSFTQSATDVNLAFHPSPNWFWFWSFEFFQTFIHSVSSSNLASHSFQSVRHRYKRYRSSTVWVRDQNIDSMSRQPLSQMHWPDNQQTDISGILLLVSRQTRRCNTHLPSKKINRCHRESPPKQTIWRVRLITLWRGFEKHFLFRVTKVPFRKSPCKQYLGVWSDPSPYRSIRFDEF